MYLWLAVIDEEIVVIENRKGIISNFTVYDDNNDNVPTGVGLQFIQCQISHDLCSVGIKEAALEKFSSKVLNEQHRQHLVENCLIQGTLDTQSCRNCVCHQQF